ncbi:MAG: acetate--CoA ligase family protein [Burkholderiales bacterium]
MTRRTPQAVLAEARAQGRKLLDEKSAKTLLSACGVRVPQGIRVAPGASAVLVEGMKPPYAAKLMSPDLIHKSDVGGVILGLLDAVAVGAAVADLAKLAQDAGLRLDGVLVEEMAPPGVELVVGGFQDARFGPVVMLGMGGVFVEVMKDTTFRVCPITRADAEDMIDQLRGAALLRGARGRDPVDESPVIDCLLAVGGDGGLLLTHEADIAELDINPLIVSRNAAVACDARVVLTSPEREA